MGQKTFVDHTCFEKSLFSWIVSGSVDPTTEASLKYCHSIADVDAKFINFGKSKKSNQNLSALRSIMNVLNTSKGQLVRTMVALLCPCHLGNLKVVSLTLTRQHLLC